METLNPFLVYATYIFVGVSANVLSLKILRDENFFNYKSPLHQDGVNQSAMLGHFYFNLMTECVGAIIGAAIAYKQHLPAAHTLICSISIMLLTLFVVTAFISKK